ncbi:Hypothetical protein CINCED_3A022811 [Cinara cedri]|uniref:Uncharacterized protein n=1 Tax=Cinara cedri TaxID=506608 RepID=A0A5E4M816_9HEMI|nr:Hypothetical protein CINCED_3A022811 [Cinara cedri]
MKLKFGFDTRQNESKYTEMVWAYCEESEAVRIVVKTNALGKRRRERPKKRQLDAIENDRKTAGVCDVEYRIK